MKIKVSIIIPNYNNARFLNQCLESVTCQKIENKEIIIVDDGSTDDSLNIIQQFIELNPEIDIKLVCQDHLNAAIARNRGLELATGDWVIFLDSDDMLEEGVLCHLAKVIEDSHNCIDLLIGNYRKIDEEGKILDERNFIQKMQIINTKKNFSQLLEFDPVPSNKLYNLELIKQYDLEWGDVKIGQDLDFFLKYLSVSKEALLISNNIYKYRISSNSISRTYDLRIFDIVSVFADVKKYYINNGNESLYEMYIPKLQLMHYNFQLSKQIFFENRKTRRVVVDYFATNEKEIDYSSCVNVDKVMKKLRRKFRMKCAMKCLYTSNIYKKQKMRGKKNER